MSIKDAMKQYFQMRREKANKGLDFLFKTPIIDDEELVIYEGKADEDEYISWKPVEIPFEQDINSFLDMNLHYTIEDYFNSYWFADLDGFYKNYYIKLQSVLPDEWNSYIQLIDSYKNNHGDKLDKVPIGIEGNGLIVVVDNRSGVVYLEDFERGSFDSIADSLEVLIKTLKLNN